MNIFVLDKDPRAAAQSHCDKHVVKMILETAQLLSTARHVGGSRIPDGIYKPTHVNHPCSIWVRANSGNYRWTWNLGVELLDEYTFRYGKIHASTPVIEKLAAFPDYVAHETRIRRTPFVTCMPDEFKVAGDPVKSYRNYYVGAKSSILRYTRRAQPSWLTI